MIKHYFNTICLLATLAYPVSIMAAEVTSLDISQQGRDIILKYNLKAQGSETKDRVSMEISLDNGRSWHKPGGLYGDIGKKIRVGKGKKIIWNPLKDYPDGLDRGVQFKLFAAGEKKNGGA
jgi:hypothetical protein